MTGHSKWSEIRHKRTVHVEADLAPDDVDDALDRLPPILVARGAGDPAVIYGHEMQQISATFQLSTKTADEAIEEGIELLSSSIEELYGSRPVATAELAAPTRP